MASPIYNVYHTDDLFSCSREKAEQVRIIDFANDFTGPHDSGRILAGLGRFPKLERITFSQLVPEELITGLSAFPLRSLWFYALPTQIPRIESETLEHLHISVMGPFNITLFNSEELHTQKYDFSGVKNLVKISIAGWGNLDYTSLAVLDKLKHLEIMDRTLSDLSWLSTGYHLDSLSIHGGLETVEGIEKQYGLEYLSLHNNNISDPSPIYKLRNLEFLELTHNCIADPGAVYSIFPFALVKVEDYCRQEKMDLEQYRSMDLPTLRELEKYLMDTYRNDIQEWIFNYTESELEQVKQMTMEKSIHLLSRVIEEKENIKNGI